MLLGVSKPHDISIMGEYWKHGNLSGFEPSDMIVGCGSGVLKKHQAMISNGYFSRESIRITPSEPGTPVAAIRQPAPPSVGENLGNAPFYGHVHRENDEFQWICSDICLVITYTYIYI